MKVPSQTQSAGKIKGKRPLQDVATTRMPPPDTEKVNRGRRSVLQVSTSASNTSVGGNASTRKPTPDEVQEQEVSSSSESETQPTKKENANVGVMTELKEAATKKYLHIPAVINSPLIIKIHEVLREEVLEKLRVRYRFGGIDPAFWKMTYKFRRDLSRNEAHTYAYLVPNKEFEVSKKEVEKR